MDNNRPQDPYDLFYNWYLQVYSESVENSNAVILATSSKSGRVSSRVVLLKQYDREGFVFFTNYNSRKAKHLSEIHFASLLFYWPDKKRQIRIEGAVEKTSHAESENYFNSRKKGHKINAIVSQQSAPVVSIDDYNMKMSSAISFYKDSEPERPPHWGGYRLVPDRFEFWEEGPYRFHSRIEYLYEDESWSQRQLQP